MVLWGGGGRNKEVCDCGRLEEQDEKRKGWTETHSALDGSEGKHVLGSVAAVSAPSLVARVVSLLQDELLSLELGVLVTHPAAEGQQWRRGRRGGKYGGYR